MDERSVSMISKWAARLAIPLVCWISISHAQLDTSVASFYPSHKGDVRQYRSRYTGMLIYTKLIDSVTFDQNSKQQLVHGRYSDGGPSLEMIDSVGNVYNLKYQSSYVHYKLYADSGNSWQAGVVNDTIPMMATVVGVYNGAVYGKRTTIKAIRFQYRISPPPQSPITLGTDYLASGFGLVESQVEPSDHYYLSGAIIDSVHYGVIASVQKTTTGPEAIDLISNYPNPFNGATTIVFQTLRETKANLTIYDVLGRLVATLVDAKFQKGTYKVEFSENALVSGTYYAVLKTDSRILLRKMLLLK